MAKKKQNLGKKHKFMWRGIYPNFVFLVVAFEPEMLESQSRALNTQFIA